MLYNYRLAYHPLVTSLLVFLAFCQVFISQYRLQQDLGDDVPTFGHLCAEVAILHVP